MEDEEKEDLKEGEDKTPTGDNQPGEKTADESEEDDSKEETVSISKSELEKLKKEASNSDNYRRAVIRLNKERGRNLPGSEPERKPKANEEEDDDDFEEKKPKGDFVTKQELSLRDEKSAISKACENEEIALNWDEVIQFYIPPKDRSYESILASINKAHRLYRADKGITGDKEEKNPNESKKAIQELASEKGLNKGKEKQPAKEKKSIIPKKEKMTDWY